MFTGKHGERLQRTPHTEAEPSWRSERLESCSQDHPLPPPARGAWSMEGVQPRAPSGVP